MRASFDSRENLTFLIHEIQTQCRFHFYKKNWPNSSNICNQRALLSSTAKFQAKRETNLHPKNAKGENIYLNSEAIFHSILSYLFAERRNVFFILHSLCRHFRANFCVFVDWLHSFVRISLRLQRVWIRKTWKTLPNFSWLHYE